MTAFTIWTFQLSFGAFVYTRIFSFFMNPRGKALVNFIKSCMEPGSLSRKLYNFPHLSFSPSFSNARGVYTTVFITYCTVLPTIWWFTFSSLFPCRLRVCTLEQNEQKKVFDHRVKSHYEVAYLIFSVAALLFIFFDILRFLWRLSQFKLGTWVKMKFG